MTEDLNSNGILSFSVDNIRVPGTIGGGKGFIEITTLLAAPDGSYHAVDSTTVRVRDFLVPTTGALVAEIAAESDQAYASTSYTITIKPEH